MNTYANQSWRVCGDADDWSASYDGSGSSEYVAIKDGSEVVALVVSHTGDPWKSPPDTTPRARLIAAAPTMYSLLAMRAKHGDNEALELIRGIENGDL